MEENFAMNERNIKQALILPNDDTKSGTNFILTFNHIARYALAAKIKFMLHKKFKNPYCLIFRGDHKLFHFANLQNFDQSTFRVWLFLRSLKIS